MQAAMEHSNNDSLMLKLNRAMGGLPEDVKEKLVTIQKTPVTIHEACKMGDVAAVTSFLDQPGDWPIDEQDAKGVSCLGYAVGANRPEVVKILLGKKADLGAVDKDGNSAL